MDKALEQLRQYEKDVWARNRERRMVEDYVAETQKQEEEWAKDAEDLKAWRKAQDDLIMKPSTCSCQCQKKQSWIPWIASCVYSAYTWMFYCRRSVLNTLFHDESKECQKLVIELPLPKHPWMCVIGTVGDDEYDVTDIVNENLPAGERLTREWLVENTDVPTDESVTWEYVDSLTFEVHEIPSEGLVNEVKPKTD